MSDDNQSANGQENAPEPGSDEYNQMMAERYRNQGADDTAPNANQDDTPAPEAMPEGGVEKFYNAETGAYNWEAHAKEMMYRQQQNAAPEAEANNEAGEQPEGADENADASDIVIRAGLDPAALEQEIINTGTINDDARAKLNAQGVSNEMIDAFAAGQKARFDAARNEGLDYVGGQEAWDGMKAWAKANLSESEQKSFNNALRSDSWQLAIDGIKARMAANSEGNLTVGNEPGTAQASGYKSRAEMQRDMNDPRYSSDPAFRQQVMQKMKAATWELDGGQLF